MAATKVLTKVIDNFTGALTADLIGDMNSGLQPISAAPFGRLPFANPLQTKGLAFIEATYNMTGSLPTATIVPTFKAQFPVSKSSTSGANVVGFDTSGAAYVIQASDLTNVTPDIDQVSKLVGLNGQDTIVGGGGIFFDANTPAGLGTIIVGTDAQQSSTAKTCAYYLSGTGSSTAVALMQSGSAFQPVTFGSAVFTIAAPRPMLKAGNGSLYIGNGRNIVSLNSSYSAVNQPLNTTDNYGDLNPSLPQDQDIKDMKTSSDGRYIILASSNVPTSINDIQPAIYQPIMGVLGYWNQTDAALSTLQYFPGMNITAIAVTQTASVMFAKDLDGVGIFDLLGNELARFEDTGNSLYPPMPHSVDVVGKYVFFLVSGKTTVSVCCFDVTTNKLYVLAIETGLTAGFIVGGLSVPTTHNNVLSSSASKEITRSKLYYFIKNDSGPNFLSRVIHLQYYSGNIQGNYATQVQEFGHKMRPVEARVYMPPMTGTTSFTLQLYDAGLNSLISKTYSYAAGSDPTLAQGSLNMVRFGLSMKAVSGFGFMLAPSSSLPFYPEKVEIDYLEQDNPGTN